MLAARKIGTANEDEALCTAALEALAGAAVLVDRDHRVAHFTSAATKLLGDLELGAHAPRLFADDPGVGLALGAERAGVISARLGKRFLRVQVTPLRSEGERARGFILALAEEILTTEPESFHGLWTRDPSMKRLFRLAEKVAATDANILIEGEMGTGKASLAAAIHALSPRHHRGFSVVRCVGATPELIERHVGDQGTLFFDDVSSLSAEAQAELLLLLERVALPLDGGKRPLDVRVITATHVPLQGQVMRGAFRADLLYRLSIVSLHLPPLRARRADVPLLVEKLIEELNSKNQRRVERVASNVFARLEHHDWPGNVRELRAAIESAFAVGDGGVLIASDLPADILDPVAPSAKPALIDHDDTTRIRRALEQARGDRSRAATLLGMSRTTLWRRMRALGLLDEP